MWYNRFFNCINTNFGENMTGHKLAQWKNNIELQNIFIRLCNKALSRYDFEGLPDTVNERVLKQALLYHGSVGFFEKEGNVLCLPAQPSNGVTLYGDFRTMYVYGRNGYNEQINIFVPGGAESSLINKPVSDYVSYKEPTGVWMRENPFCFPFIQYCMSYAERIADSMRVLDINRHHMKIPYIIVADEQVIPTVKKTMQQVDDNVNYIVSSGVFPVDRVNIIQTPIGPDTLKTTTDLIEWYYNDFDELCGKNSNSNPDKKERLLVDEVNANNESTKTSINELIDFMQTELDFVNKSLGTNITVKKKEEDEDDDICGMDTDAGSEEMGTTERSDKSGD